MLVIDDNMEFKVYPFNTLNGYFSADIMAIHKESGYFANISIEQHGNTPAVGSRQANLLWRLQKGSCLKKLEVSNLI